MRGRTRSAVLYARVSTDEQTKGYSLRQQLEALRSYAASEGYEVVEECEDPGYSGTFLDRPDLDRARSSAGCTKSAAAAPSSCSVGSATRPTLGRPATGATSRSSSSARRGYRSRSCAAGTCPASPQPSLFDHDQGEDA